MHLSTWLSLGAVSAFATTASSMFILSKDLVFAWCIATVQSEDRQLPGSLLSSSDNVCSRFRCSFLRSVELLGGPPTWLEVMLTESSSSSTAVRRVTNISGILIPSTAEHEKGRRDDLKGDVVVVWILIEDGRRSPHVSLNALPPSPTEPDAASTATNGEQSSSEVSFGTFSSSAELENWGIDTDWWNGVLLRRYRSLRCASEERLYMENFLRHLGVSSCCSCCSAIDAACCIVCRRCSCRGSALDFLSWILLLIFFMSIVGELLLWRGWLKERMQGKGVRKCVCIVTGWWISCTVGRHTALFSIPWHHNFSYCILASPNAPFRSTVGIKVGSYLLGRLRKRMGFFSG